jgi:FixJ family two-component response regulator
MIAECRREWDDSAQIITFPAPDAEENARHDGDRPSRISAVAAALEEITEAERSLLDRLIVQGETESQIALESGVSRQTVSRRKLRALAALALQYQHVRKTAMASGQKTAARNTLNRARPIAGGSRR